MAKHAKSRGVAAVEFAILLPLLLLIVFGITEFGRALYTYNTLVKAVRDGARYVMMQQAGGAADVKARCLTVYGNTGCTGNPLAPGLDKATVSICDSVRCLDHQTQGAAPVVNLVSVTISNYSFQSYVPFVTANLASFKFGPISATMKGNL